MSKRIKLQRSGAFIGSNGSNIKKMKSECQCNIILKDEHTSSKQKSDQVTTVM